MSVQDIRKSFWPKLSILDLCKSAITKAKIKLMKRVNFPLYFPSHRFKWNILKMKKNKLKMLESSPECQSKRNQNYVNVQ